MRYCVRTLVVEIGLYSALDWSKLDFRSLNTPPVPRYEVIMDESEITAAVQACLSDALKSDKPFRSINDSLATLKRHGWTKQSESEVRRKCFRS